MGGDSWRHHALGGMTGKVPWVKPRREDRSLATAFGSLLAAWVDVSLSV